MSDQIEVVSDGEGLVVIGSMNAVQRFLEDHGLATLAEDFELSRLRKALSIGSDIFESISTIAEQSAMYLKLTPDSAKRLKDTGGLMSTKTKGISHAMLGKTGDTSMKWLQVDTRVSSMITNPALLTGIGSLMSQFVQQTEAQELRKYLATIDGKLDDVRRAQRNAVIAPMQTATAQIEEAQTLRKAGGDPGTLWDKVQGAHPAIMNVQEETLLALGSLAEKAQAESKLGTIKKFTGNIEQEVIIHLTVLARCFELEDQFRIIELDHVMATAPDHFEGHLQGQTENRAKRHDSVLGKTQMLMQELDRVGVIANENILLHPKVARAVVKSLNSTATSIAEFHEPLGMAIERDEMNTVSWREAFLDPYQLKTAGKEVGEKALIAAGAAGAIALLTLAPKRKQ